MNDAKEPVGKIWSQLRTAVGLPKKPKVDFKAEADKIKADLDRAGKPDTGDRFNDMIPTSTTAPADGRPLSVRTKKIYLLKHIIKYTDERRGT